jgi:hypothetical protein
MFEGNRGGYWAILGLVALYCVTAAGLTGNPLFFFYDDRPSAKFLVVWALPVLFWYTLVAVRLMGRRRPDPFARIARYTRLNRKWLVRTFVLIAVMVLWASAFTILKIAIPGWQPYYADPALVAFDRALLGTDAWRLTHAVIGEIGTVVLDRLYLLWFTVLLGFMAWVIGTRDRAFQVQGLLSFVLTWLVLGTLLATALASVGPCYYAEFYGRADFAPLMERLGANPQPLTALAAMEYLRSVQGTAAYAGGISAMPSLHMGMATWFVLVAREGAKSRVPMLLAMAYAAAILVGSVHLGWHYLSDGLVSMAITPAIWVLVRKLLAARPAYPSSQGTIPACAT